MGPNCLEHIVIVLETFADLEKELHIGVSWLQSIIATRI
jgi:hypothetical protein